MRSGSTVPGNILRKGVVFLQSSRGRTCYFSVSLAFPVLILAACLADRTWWLPGSDKGLSQYYGFWAIFATTPLILWLTSRLYSSFTVLIVKPERYCTNLKPDARARIQKLAFKHADSLSLSSDAAWILVFIMIALLFCWVFNAINTLSPTPLHTFHHDVFDSSAHRLGYIVTRCYTLFFFVLVYAPALFLALHVTASMISILKFLYEHDGLHIDFFHADNCGGTSQFGNVNLIILGIYGSFFAIICAMYITHRQAYFVMLVSLVACSVLALVQSVAAVYYIHVAVSKKKRLWIMDVALRLNQQLAPSLRGERFPSDLLTLRNHVIGLHSFPYAGGALVVVNVIRFAPALIAVIGFFRR